MNNNFLTLIFIRNINIDFECEWLPVEDSLKISFK